MKTLILYATKYGATYEIARRIAERMDGAVIHDLKNDGMPSLEEFDCVIAGSSVYVGMIRKEAKAFLAKNTAALCNMKFGLFLSGLEPGKENELFSTNFSPQILQSAKAKVFLDGIFDPKKIRLFDRILLKMAAKPSKYMNTINDEKIKEFAEAMGL